MAITPKQATTVPEVQMKKIEEAEKQIDKELEGMEIGEKRLIYMTYGLTDRSYNELKSRYTRVGWSVIKTKKEQYGDRPGSYGTPYLVDAWEFSALKDADK